jgi:hypothetical protein
VRGYFDRRWVASRWLRSQRRAVVIALLLAAALLDDAEAALAAGDAKCGDLAQAALSAGDLAEDGVARAWTVRARCYALAGDADRAERSNGVVAALAALRAKARAEQVTGDVVIDRVVVELESDDLNLVRAASLWRGDEEVARFPLTNEAGRHVVADIPLGGLVLRLHDKHGNTLWRTDVPRPERVIERGASPAKLPTALTTVGAGAIGVGLMGAIASGIGLAANGPDDGQLWLVGVGAATGVFLVGAALVVVDQGL